MGKRNEWNGSFAMNERRRGSEQPTAQSVYLSVKLLAEAESFGPISINPPGSLPSISSNGVDTVRYLIL